MSRTLSDYKGTPLSDPSVRVYQTDVEPIRDRTRQTAPSPSEMRSTGNHMEHVPEEFDGPFRVNLRDDGGTWKVTVNRGYVIERKLTAGTGDDALLYHLPNNIETLGDPTEFTVTNGDAVFVFVPETGNGDIDGANVDIRVATAATESTNHINGVQVGEYYYKLAVFTLAGSDGSLENFAAGSHIYHPTGLTADVLIEDCSGNQYEDPIVPGAMIFRLSFVSGKLAALNDTELVRPLATNFVREQIGPCTEFTEPPP